MAQGRKALNNLLSGKASWPPVVVPFGLDPFGWHGEHLSYSEVCNFALEHCTLLPKVYPFPDPLAFGMGDVCTVMTVYVEDDMTMVNRYELTGSDKLLYMEKVQTPGDASWKVRKRWIENDDDLDYFINLSGVTPAEPDVDAVRKKEQQVCSHGLPYVEVNDPFYTVSEMFPTDTFFIKTLTDTERVTMLLSQAEERILYGIETLCREAGCPFILRLIGAEMAAPPFMSRDDFLRFEGRFYYRAADIACRYGIPAAFHCHGPVSKIMNDVWGMGYSIIEPFEPKPRGDVTIAHAFDITKGRGIVFGGIDEVIFMNGTQNDVRAAVSCCLDDARDTCAPYILSQTATPFYDPLTDTAKKNMLLFMELGIQG